MNKCVGCGRKNEGIICKHCLAKYASNVGKFSSGAGKYVAMFVGTIATTKLLEKLKK